MDLRTDFLKLLLKDNPTVCNDEPVKLMSVLIIALETLEVMNARALVRIKAPAKNVEIIIDALNAGCPTNHRFIYGYRVINNDTVVFGIGREICY